jgi:ring-1,2-phenylacetyl-CoA epoxidase subunit PaaD
VSLATRHDADEQAVWSLLGTVMDPEIPVLSVVDLGIVRHVRLDGPASVQVGVSPTYTGCPATDVIRADIERALRAEGFQQVRIDAVLSPPWTSDWISERGRERLRRYGIAPPPKSVTRPRDLLARPPVACPRCDSERTERISEFGSTPCKAHYRCNDCAEPFDHFKCI